MASNAEMLLCAILDCGIADLSVIEDCEYDMEEIAEECRFQFGKVSLNGMSECIFYKGKRGIQDAIDDRINEIEDIDEESRTSDEREEYVDLLSLNPYEDIEEFHNFLDTSVWFKKNGSLYKKYVPSALERFEQNTGYYIEGGEDDA